MLVGTTDGTFDEKAVLNQSRSVVKKFMKMYGQDVRRAAQRMIKKPKKPKEGEPTPRSRPGEPPFNQTGVYKKLIEYGISEDGLNVSIGPVQFEGKSQGAYALEHGGKTVLTIRPMQPPKKKPRRKKTQRKITVRKKR